MNIVFLFLEIVYLFSFFVLVGIAFHYFWSVYLFAKHRNRKVVEDKGFVRAFYRSHSIEDLPPVLTQIPIYNEKFVAKRIIDSVVSMDYPKEKHNIQVLDDSNDDTFEIVRAEVEKYQRQGYRINHIRRPTREGFKAGALKYGMSLSKEPFIVIFDADFIPPKIFLKHTIPYFFMNAKIACLQTRWGYVNRNHSLLTRYQSIGIDGYFLIEQSARSWNNLYINFGGTGGIWRRKAIEDSGGWQADTLTEDLDLSYRSHIKGWRIHFVPHVVCPSEIPETMNDYKSQQYRWAKGSSQTARKLMRPLWGSPASLLQKFEGSFHLLQYSCHLFVLVILILHAALKFGHIQMDTPILIERIFLPYPLVFIAPSFLFMYSQQVLFKKKAWKSFVLMPYMIAVGVGISINNAVGIFSAWFGSKGEFVRTPKSGRIADPNSIRSLKKRLNVKEVIQQASSLLNRRKKLYKTSNNYANLFWEIVFFVYTFLAAVFFFRSSHWLEAFFYTCYTLIFGYMAFNSLAYFLLKAPMKT